MVRIKTVLSSIAYGISLLGFIPLFPYLELLPKVLYPLAFICGVIADRTDRHLPGRFTTAASFLLFLYYVPRFKIDNLVVPAVNLLVILLAVRLATEKSGRNYLQIFALAFFSLASSSLFNLDPVFLFYLLAMLVMLALSLVLLTFYAEGDDPAFSWSRLKTIMGVAAIMPAASLPLMLLFFFILPRTQFPLWNFLNQAGGAATGFNETVRPGASTSVSEVKSVVFRATCGKLPKNNLYWRGIVLNVCEGNSWSRGAVPSGEQPSVIRGESVTQTIYPEPARSVYLFALNFPVKISGVRQTDAADLVYKGAAGTRRVKYEAVSVLTDTIKTKGEINRNFYLRLPPRLSERFLAQGRFLGRKGRSDADKLALLEAFYHEQNLAYATTNLPVGEDPLDEFLFDKKRGHCEFFASSCALLLRSAGIPARLVGGYYGGSYNDIGGYYVVTEEMAHVWVEAYIAGRGWVSLDPSSWSRNFAGAAEGREAWGRRQVRMYLDALGYFWNRGVIAYDLEKQLQLLSMADFRIRNVTFVPRRLIQLLLPVAGVLALAALFVYCRRRPLSREETLLKQFFQVLARLYPHEEIPGANGLYSMAERLGNPHVKEFVDLFGGAVYRDRPLTDGEVVSLRRIIQTLGKRARTTLL